MAWFTNIKKRSVQVKILLVGVLLGTSFASHACGIHDQLCVFHGVGIPRTSYDVSNPTTSLVIYARGENGSSGAAKTDFDNHVLLPTTTSNSTWMGTTSTQPTGPYVDFTTSYGAANPPKVWSDPSTLPAHVYPSQYQVIFNQNTAQAVHTGDFNGGENGQTPSQYATGCLGRGTNPDCEEVVVTGNVPNGTYSQKIQFFNFYGDPNPKVDLYVGAYATGHGVLISPNHLPSDQNTTLEQTKIFNEAIKNGTSSVGDYIQLQGNQAVSKQFDYQFYNRGFDAHAVGVTLYDQNIRKNLGWGDSYWVKKDNGVQEKIQQHQFRVDKKTTLVGGYGGSTVSVQKGANRVDGQRVLDTIVPLPPVVAPASFTLVAGNAASSCKNYIECYQGTTQSIMPNGNQGLSYGNGMFWNPSANISIAPITTGYYFHSTPWADGAEQLQQALGDKAVEQLSQYQLDKGSGNYVGAALHGVSGFGIATVEAIHKVFTPTTWETTALTFAPVVSKFIKPAASLVPSGFGSTGRMTALTLEEQIAIKAAISNPNVGVVIMKNLKDPRWLGWDKMQITETLSDGQKIVIHYAAKFENGVIVAIDDFKFK